MASDNTSISIVKDHEAYPVPAAGPSPIAGLQTLQVLADATNGTLFYDLDADTTTNLKNFSTEASTLVGKYVRVAARYQANGTLVAVRVWASSTWSKVWISPEGQVRHVDTTNNLIYVDNENGVETPIIVNAATNFFFRTPGNALADTTPIGTGTAFLANLVRGFKVHVGADPLAANLTAKTVDIEIAKFEGTISSPSTTQFTYTRNFVGTADDYTMTLPYCNAAAKNGKDSSWNQILGFKWWNFTYPTLADTGTTAIPDFVAAVGGSANFGGTFGAMKAWGMSYAIWGDGVTPGSTGWSTKWAVLEPTLLPRGTVATPLVNSAGGGTFGLSLPTGKTSVTVDVSTASGSATLIYDVSVSGGVVTITPVDITTAAGQNLLASYLVSGTPVRVYGIPQADGSIKAYYINCFF